MKNSAHLVALVAYAESCLRVAIEEMALWRMENTSRIAALDALPPAEREAATKALMTEVIDPLIRALDDIGRAGQALH